MLRKALKDPLFWFILILAVAPTVYGMYLTRKEHQENATAGTEVPNTQD